MVDDSLSPTSRLGDAIDVFVRREDAERFIEEIRGDEPKLATRLRIEERVLDRRAMASPAVRLPARRPLAVRLASPVPGLFVPANPIRVEATRFGEIDRQALEADDVHDRMARRYERRLAAELG